MIIVNADDLGRSQEETDVILSCYKAGRITSASAMVFMKDSCRAAEFAQMAGIDLGLHLNLSQPFTGEVDSRLAEHHNRIVQFITSHRYAFLVYNPALRQDFRLVYQAQFDEFVRLYGRYPSHIDGHHHKHLCTNILFDGIIPPHERVRRNFSFWHGEKNFVNRAYRRMIDLSLSRRYQLTDFFFSLQECLQHDRLMRVFDLSRVATVELMTHPADTKECAYLMGDIYLMALRKLEMGTYASL